MKKSTVIIGLVAALIGGMVPTVQAAGPSGATAHHVGSQLAVVRQATARYHRLDAALEAGFRPFSIDPADPDHPTCFDNGTLGGMGVHYVKGIDGILDPAAPEAMVYALTDHGPRLVAVEYIIPEGFVDPLDPPSLFGQTLHHHSFLPVYILHAWVWKHNPAGVFADFNPNVGSCPDA
ncbi:MAG: hypothetical protein ABIO83_11405 [Ilumatobacteraceae bacterium]